MTEIKPTSTTAAVLKAPDARFSLERVQLSEPYPDEILVRIEACGVCHTDSVCRHIVPMPGVLGHEGVGIIEELGTNVRDLCRGDRVVLCYPFCGACDACSRQQPYYCEQNASLSFSGRRLDKTTPISMDGEPISGAFFQQSSFAERAICTARSAVRIDSDVPSEVLAALPCGIATGVGSLVNALSVTDEGRVLIFGAGPVGLGAVMGAAIAGASEIVVADVNTARLQIARELGATEVIRSDDPDTAMMLSALAPTGFPVVYDTSSAAAAWELALEHVSAGGVFAFVAVPAPMDAFTIKPIRLMYRAAQLRAIIQGASSSHALIPQLLAWRAEGRLPVDRLIRTFAFEQINEAFAASTGGDAVKAILKMRH